MHCKLGSLKAGVGGGGGVWHRGEVRSWYSRVDMQQV